MNVDMSLVSLLTNASILVQLVMLLLLLASLVSWTMIFRKWATLKLESRRANDFEQRFWSGGDLGEIYKQVASRTGKLTGMENIFEAGFKEFARLRKHNSKGLNVIDGSQRAMRVALAREMDALETYLSFLATVGSTSPYIGLFGTVWGIMNAFIGISRAQTTNLSVVAPGIAEALLATALGLVAAIPAVMIYNVFARGLAEYRGQLGDVVSEILRVCARDLDRGVQPASGNTAAV